MPIQTQREKKREDLSTALWNNTVVCGTAEYNKVGYKTAEYNTVEQSKVKLELIPDIR